MRQKLLMVGVHRSHTGGMWTVAQNYLGSARLTAAFKLRYLPLSHAGGRLRRVAYSAAAFARYLVLLLLWRPNLVYLHTASKGSFWRKSVAARLAAALGIPVVMHLHGAQFQAFYAGLGRRGRRYVQNTFLRCGAVICLGQVWADFITGICGGAVRTVVLHNAVPVPDENPYDPAAGELAFFGRVGRRKGAFDLLEALARVNGRLPPQVSCRLYGDGELDKAAALIAAHGLDGRVKLCGWQGPEACAAARARAMVNLLPSYNEGLPMALLEAMAMGVPSITTRVAAIPELVKDGVNGILLEPGDIEGLSRAILRLAGDPALRAEMSARAYETVRRNFSLDKHLEALAAICERVAAGR